MWLTISLLTVALAGCNVACAEDTPKKRCSARDYFYSAVDLLPCVPAASHLVRTAGHSKAGKENGPQQPAALSSQAAPHGSDAPSRLLGLRYRIVRRVNVDPSSLSAHNGDLYLP